MISLVVSCEHGSNAVPVMYYEKSQQYKTLLATHEGWDIGAYAVAKQIADFHNTPFFSGEISRLLIDLNRSLWSKGVFGKIGNRLNENEKKDLITHYYDTYRSRVLQKIRELSTQSFVVHLSIHSFTPVFNGVVRHGDIGLLYDPSRFCEKQYSSFVKDELNMVLPNVYVRMNYPYRGVSDGHTTALRKIFSEKVYCGIEVELNQKYLNDFSRWGELLAPIFLQCAQRFINE